MFPTSVRESPPFLFVMFKVLGFKKALRVERVHSGCGHLPFLGVLIWMTIGVFCMITELDDVVAGLDVGGAAGLSRCVPSAEVVSIGACCGAPDVDVCPKFPMV